MTNKINICIVYSHQPEPPHVAYENEYGIIWRSGKPLSNMFNIGMGNYSLSNPGPKDSLLVLEPICVLPQDYNIHNISKYYKIFTWAIKAFENTEIASKTIEINHPSVRPRDIIDIKKSWTDWNSRRNEIVLISNNKTSTHSSELYSLRLTLADALIQNSEYKVSWYGETAVPRSCYAGKLKNKDDVLKRVKFSICIENSYDHIYSTNYYTEKLPETWLSGCVPIYMGCHNIDNLNLPKNENSYIDLRPFVKDNKKVHISSLVNKLLSYDSSCHEQMLNSLEQNIIDPKGFFYETSWTRVYDKMIDTFYQEENNLPSV